MVEVTMVRVAAVMAMAVNIDGDSVVEAVMVEVVVGMIVEAAVAVMEVLVVVALMFVVLSHMH